MIVDSKFDGVAEAVIERTAELLSAPVSVIDDRGVVISSSRPDEVGKSLLLSDPQCDNGMLQVPLHLESGLCHVVVTQPASGNNISPRLARVLVELMISQTMVVDRLPNKHELKNNLIHDLLYGSQRDESVILREAQILGMNLAHTRVVMLIDAANYILDGRSEESPSADNLRRRAQFLIGSIVGFFELPNDTICAYIGNGEVAVLKASNKQSLVPWVDDGDERDLPSPSWAHLPALKRASEALLARLRSDTGAAVNIGIGRYYPGLSGLARSHQDARAALSLGRRFHGENGVHCLDGLGIAGFVGLSDERTKIDLATYLLSPLDHEPDLLITLEAFFSNDRCPSVTSARLCIHRNTLSYRLDKITSLTGLDARHFDDAVQIRLALVLRSFRPQRCLNEAT